MAELVELLAAGRSHAGWESVSITRSIEHAAGGFSLVVSERWPGVEAPRQVRAGDACELTVGGQTVITGFVDEAESDLDAASHLISVAGRDKVADLIDCGAVRKSGQWRGLRIEQIAAELAAPFDIRVSADVDTGKALTSFALQEGESVFEAISRAARIRALLLVSDGKGGLLITRAGETRVATVLEMGVNLLSCRVKLDLKDRFSSYLLKGQAPGTDWLSGASAAQVAAKAADPGVRRYRPLVITADAPDIAATLQQRAQWEANSRAARSLTVTGKVQGWRHAGGLWAPNTRVKVVSEEQHVSDELLVTGVEFSLAEGGGSTTTLTMTRADAFTLLPLKAPDAQGAFWTLPAKGEAK
ncbi:phage baseplate assembly protein [Roseateles sp. DXS20W]|uniref:Phage baseplate assembly protein n=1 Tax=Pelomonas lactea TaxID=3299030 RepID=A0ABW7GKC3_9BURK